MSDHLDIEKLFKEQLSEVEYPASQNAWNAISSSIANNAATSAATSTTGSILGLGKLGSIIAIASTVGVISAGAVYFSMNHKIKTLEEKIVTNTPKPNLEHRDVSTNSSALKEDQNKEGGNLENTQTVPKTNIDLPTNNTEMVVNEGEVDTISIESTTDLPNVKSKEVVGSVDDKENITTPTSEANPIEENKEEQAPTVNEPTVNQSEVDEITTLPVENSVEMNMSTSSGYAPLDVIFSSNGNGIKETWDFGDGETSEELLPKHTYSRSGEYTVKLTSVFSNGESKTVTSTIIVNKGSSINEPPNVFTPNYDGNNDEYYLRMEGIKFFKGYIQDSKQNTVFQLSSPDQKWNGKDHFNQDLPEGVYYLIYKAEGVDGVPYSGKVSITLER